MTTQSITKRFLLAGAAFVLLPVLLAAQERPGYWRDVNPAADGRAVQKELRSKGLRTATTSTADTLRLRDRYAGRDCTVEIPARSQDRYTASIEVVFPDKDTWEAMLAEYNAIEEALRADCGGPSATRKEFPNERVMRRRANRLLDLREGFCTWYTVWDSAAGRTTLSMRSDTEYERVYNVITIQNF